MTITYLHTDIAELTAGFLVKGNVQIGVGDAIDDSKILSITLASMRLAMRLGIQGPSSAERDGLPYGDASDTLLFEAPVTTAIVNRRLAYLRGWKQFGSCVKGFNTLGLMAEQVLAELARLKGMPREQVDDIKREFARTRHVKGEPTFRETELAALTSADLAEVRLFDLAIWRCFAKKPIVCSTSSNMGISTHQVLRLMQRAKLTLRDRETTILNEDEGSLVIWCPDERADFMNAEKTRMLRALEEEKPALTRLRTYINRQQRDPGALRDALLAGGYFFPTNPQSKDEIQNLIFVALNDLSKEEGVPLETILARPNVRETLESLGCEVFPGKVHVRRGVEGGIYGLMLPYVILLDEYIAKGLGDAVSTWNQASIGAALAALVLMDRILRDPSRLRDDVRGELNNFFPNLSRFLDTKRLGRDLDTQIHGVFDLANLQSLAQLLGVVVERHLSGRGTAYVGLGSSSYSNGNRCFEILRESLEHGGAFRGKTAFHPATHTLNPVAQAIVFGEDLYRYLARAPSDITLDEATLRAILRHARKPEPAGAAGLAGYLLTRLDMRTLSIAELAYGMSLVGFDGETFLQFMGYSGAQGMSAFVQQCQEEGVAMGSFAKNLLLLLDWPAKDLERIAATEKKHSLGRYWENPLDDLAFEHKNGLTCICLTGDNSEQPSLDLTKRIAERCLANRATIARFIAATKTHDDRLRLPGSRAYPVLLIPYHVARRVSSFGAKLEEVSKKLASGAFVNGGSRNGWTS